jgi:hypothetical protein
MSRGAVMSRLTRVVALLTTLVTFALLSFAGGASFSGW